MRYYLWGECTNSARLRTPGEKSKQVEKFIDERGRVTMVHVCVGGQLTDLKNMANYQEGAKITYRDIWSDYTSFSVLLGCPRLRNPWERDCSDYKMFIKQRSVNLVRLDSMEV